MLIIIAHNLAGSAKEKLSAFGEIMELRTEAITCPALSSHPDIFFCQSPVHLFVAPNLPAKYYAFLDRKQIGYIKGEQEVGPEYPDNARFNAVVTDKYLIHNFRHTDFTITRAVGDLTPVHVNQGYCRCNLLPLRDDHFITSDAGIYKILKRLHLDIIFVSPEDILLAGFPNGFFGGCCGVMEDRVFINGSLKFYREGDKVIQYLKGLDYQIIELFRGPLIDVGSIFFLSSHF